MTVVARERNITSTSEYRHRRHQRHSHHQNREMLREVHANEANVTTPPRASTGPVRRQGHRASRGEKVGMETRGTQKDEPRFTNRSRRRRRPPRTRPLSKADTSIPAVRVTPGLLSADRPQGRSFVRSFHRTTTRTTPSSLAKGFTSIVSACSNPSLLNTRRSPHFLSRRTVRQRRRPRGGARAV